MSYTSYDFTETLSGQNIDRTDVKRAVAAHGENGDYAEWTGGFLVELKSGKFVYLTGWCDTTGWGCQDGTEKTEYDELPDLKTLNDEIEWDIDPADLNKFIETGEGECL